MWASKGRSGYGDATLQGDYDDWQGLSRNGRQWKNPATMQTRNLSGAAYWSLRKQDTPKQEIPVDMYAVNDTANLAHTLPNGQANLLKYADPVRVKKTTKIPLEDRILPQLKRLNTLRAQMVELEAEYRTTDMSIEKYSLLRDLIVAKIQRQEELYKRAASVKPKSYEEPLDNTPHSSSKTHEYDGEMYSQNSDSCDRVVQQGYRESEEIGYGFIDELSESNFFKNPLKKACKVWKAAVQWHQKARNYINELKAV